MALYAIASSVMVPGPPMGIVADEYGGDYVHGGGVRGHEVGLDAERVVNVARALQRHPQSAEEWMALACHNLGYVSISQWAEAESIYEAKDAVRDEVEAGYEAWLGEEAAREAKRAAERAARAERAAQIPEDRQARLGRIAEAAYHLQMDDDGGLSPEDELTFQIAAAGDVDPQQKHQWMPPTLQDPAWERSPCVFCEEGPGAEIHQRWWER